MDIVLICRSAQEDSVIGNVALAMEARKAGREAAVVFTGEALAALIGESFGWSPLLQNRDARMTISRNAQAAGIPASSTKDARWTDIPRLLEGASQSGVRLVACPIWSQLLGVDGQVPAALLEKTDTPALLTLLSEAKTVVGGY